MAKGKNAASDAQATDANEGTPDPTNGTLTHAEYTLAGSIPEALRGSTVKTKDCNGNLDVMHQLVEDGKPENVARLAQAQYDIIVQRKIRDAATSEEIEGILGGKVVEVDGEKLDFSGMSAEERKAYAIGRLQAVADDYVYGARPLIAGGAGKAAKEALGREKGLKAAAAADPELAAKLAALGYTL
jgi:hypothetical protein